MALDALYGVPAAGWRDGFLTLLGIDDLHIEAFQVVGGAGPAHRTEVTSGC